MNTLKIYITGVGGQGNVLASKLLGEAALKCHVPVLVSETHGMAQRGGVVESAVVLGNCSSPVIADHCADVILAFEPMEAVRALNKAHAGTQVITSIAAVSPFIPGGQNAVYPEMAELLTFLKSKVVKLVMFDARSEALAAANPLGLNMVMLGALYRTVELPITVEEQLAVIAVSGKAALAQANKECFERGFAAAGVGQV